MPSSRARVGVWEGRGTSRTTNDLTRTERVTQELTGYEADRLHEIPRFARNDMTGNRCFHAARGRHAYPASRLTFSATANDCSSRYGSPIPRR